MPPKIFHGSQSFPVDARPVLTIGNFDGVHLGHVRLLDALVTRSKELGQPAAVYTFDPSPRQVLQPESCPPRILTLDQKLSLLGHAGVDMVVLEPFTLELGARSARHFADRVIGAHLHPAAMVVGYDFRYGEGRSGDIETLRAHFPELSVQAVDPRVSGERIISSSAIREAVAQGKVALASSYLGRPYQLSGSVIHGQARGRTLGFPTANLRPEQELLPAMGVYAVRAGVAGQDKHPGVANVGTRPSFQGSGLLLEVHLLQGGGDLYGQQLEVDLVAHLRAERRFEDGQALRAQIQADVEQARAALAQCPPA